MQINFLINSAFFFISNIIYSSMCIIFIWEIEIKIDFIVINFPFSECESFIISSGTSPLDVINIV